jgi:hypothetical protein
MYDEAIILDAIYERNFEGRHQIRLILKIYSTFGICDMFFIGEDKINELFDDYHKIYKVKDIETKLCDFKHKEVFVPKVCLTCVPDGLCFTYDDAQAGNFVENCNGRL